MSMAYLIDARPDEDRFHNKETPNGAVINLARFVTSWSALLKNKPTFTHVGADKSCRHHEEIGKASGGREREEAKDGAAYGR